MDLVSLYHRYIKRDYTYTIKAGNSYIMGNIEYDMSKEFEYGAPDVPEFLMRLLISLYKLNNKEVVSLAVIDFVNRDDDFMYMSLIASLGKLKTIRHEMKREYGGVHSAGYFGWENEGIRAYYQSHGWDTFVHKTRW